MTPSRPDVSVISSGHDVADARLHREVAALCRAGLSVEVSGLGAAADAPEAVSVRVRDRGGLAARALLALRLPWEASGRVLLAIEPAVALAAWPAARLRRRALVVDVHEDYAAVLADRAWARGAAGRAARLLVALAQTAARRADLTVVADEHVPPSRARQRLVVRNLPDVEHLPEPVAPDPRPRAVYIGDLRASRGLFTMLDAVAAAPDWRLDLVGQVSPADAAEVERRLADEDLAGRARLHGRLPPARAWSLVGGAWVGLALLHDTPAFREATPGELYEYLACGLPLLVSDLPPMARVLGSTGAGRGVPPGDAAATAAVLRSWATPGGPTAEHARLRDAALVAGAQLRQGSPYAGFADAVARLI